MKKVIVSAFISLFVLSAFAQKPIKGESGFMFGISGVQGLHLSTEATPTGTLGFRYMISDKDMLRAGVRYGYSKSTSHSDTTGNGIDTTKIVRNSVRAINIGVQHSLGKSAKLDPYVGCEFTFGLVNGSLDQKVEAISTTTPGAVVGDVEQLTADNVGKSSIYGIHSFAGCNYFFSDHIAIGAEFGYGATFTKTKNGNATIKRTGSTFGPAGTTVVTNSSNSNTAAFGGNTSGMITISVFF